MIARNQVTHSNSQQKALCHRANAARHRAFDIGRRSVLAVYGYWLGCHRFVRLRIRPRVVACGQLHQIHENSEDIQETYRLAGHAGGYEQAYRSIYCRRRRRTVHPRTAGCVPPFRQFRSLYRSASGSEAIEVIEKVQPDLIVLDVMLPDIDGFTVTRRIRQEGINAPVLFLTARDDTQDKVMGPTVGGDDYVTKPFSLEEVVARIRAILRRTREQTEEDPIIRVGDLEINEDSHDVTRSGQTIDLSPTEYKLLRYLRTMPAVC